jgi:capsid protein
LVVAKFDSAKTTPENRKHWANADGLSPNAAINPEVRRILRNRARYEVANNSYAKGIVLTLANDTIGTGPRLQMLTDDADANARIEEAFDRWARAVDLPGKLRTMRMARAESGEAFALLVSNPAIASPVSLDLKLIEADQVATPLLRRGRDDEVDGIVLDAWGNPSAYRVLKRHPGDGGVFRTPIDDLTAYDTFPASSVVHYFRPDRPGQLRGIPDITPALPLFAQLRRYTLATIAAAGGARPPPTSPPSSTPTAPPTARPIRLSRWTRSNSSSVSPQCSPADGSWGRSTPSSRQRRLASSSARSSTRSRAA